MYKKKIRKWVNWAEDTQSLLAYTLDQSMLFQLLMKLFF